ncbi:MAG: heme ABC transporter ATP-binding protein [Lautropia sp.]
MLTADAISCSRGRRRVLDAISLAVAPGEVVGVLGANGAGKSTLLAALAGELPVADGQVAFDGRPLGAWPRAELARRRAVLPQSSLLTFDLPVATVIEMGSYPHDGTVAASERAHALALADVGALLERRYLQLSGGEQQRVQFARVLLQLLANRAAGEFRALLLDEPTASLDPRHQLQLLGAVATLAHDQRIAALVVLHDVNLAAVWCDRLLLLADGQVVAQGAPAEVLTVAALQRVYRVGVRITPRPGHTARPLVLFEPQVEPGG